MPVYPFDNRPLTWNPSPPHRRGSFRGTGRLETHGPKLAHNPGLWDTRRTVAGRLIVGFNVGEVPTWKMTDLIDLVKRVRNEQTGDPSSTYVAQTGIYQHRDGSSVVTEDGAQVFIIAGDADEVEFEKQMIQLAEIIARKLKQESVIVEIQINGISQHTIGVGP